jgi:hypothetical protein
MTAVGTFDGATVDAGPLTIADASRWSAGDGGNAGISREANGTLGTSREVIR